MTRRVLTGIQPTGTPHVGNLLGAIRPALALADSGLEAMYFIADYHALTSIHDRAKLAGFTREVAATWLAFGLDPDRVLFYRQSDIPEIFELTWVLACHASKSWLDKGHAFKAATAAGDEVNLGRYSYPLLMAADILAFDTDLVPVGKDQVQHIEITRDIAQRFNHEHGAELLKLPNAVVDEGTAATVPGIDGRKMSKSYGNAIPLFAPAKQLRKIVGQIITDSTPPEAPKDPDSSLVHQIYRAVATPDEARELADRLRAGIGWGDAKQVLFERLDRELAGPREHYAQLMADPVAIDALLAAGAAKARPIARATVDRVRKAIGID